MDESARRDKGVVKLEREIADLLAEDVERLRDAATLGDHVEAMFCWHLPRKTPPGEAGGYSR